MAPVGDMGPAWVYRCFDDTGRLIYVGSTTNIWNRVETHLRASWWGHQIAKVKGLVFPDMFAARAVEREAIKFENPRWNVMGRWQARLMWSADDYRDYATALLCNSQSSYYNRTHFQRVAKEAAFRFGIHLAAPEEVSA